MKTNCKKRIWKRMRYYYLQALLFWLKLAFFHRLPLTQFNTKTETHPLPRIKDIFDT